MWFGCRTQSQDLLHSTPCPDGTSSRALGITPCHVGELSFHRVQGAWERFAKRFDAEAQNSRPEVTVPSMYWEIEFLQVSLQARSKPHFFKLAQE